MLIVLPPSETKRPVRVGGPPVDLDALSFPELTPTRARVLDALIATSAGPDGLRRLQVGPSLAEEVARNTALRDLPAMPALDVYAGPLHQGLDAASLSPAARSRADAGVVVCSALFGALRPADRIPPYRLHICSALVDLDRLEPTWRAVLPGVLADAAGANGVVLDLRSPGWQAVGLPDGPAERIVTLRIQRTAGGGRPVGDVIAKRMRGEAAHHLLEAGVAGDDPRELEAVLAERWGVSLDAPARPGRSWTLTLLTAE